MIYTLLSFTEEAISNHVHLIASKKADFKVKVQEDILDQKVSESLSLIFLYLNDIEI